MVFAALFLAAYLGVSFMSGCRALIGHNTPDAPFMQILFALLYGLTWPWRLKRKA